MYKIVLYKYCVENGKSFRLLLDLNKKIFEKLTDSINRVVRGIEQFDNRLIRGIDLNDLRIGTIIVKGPKVRLAKSRFGNRFRTTL